LHRRIAVAAPVFAGRRALTARRRGAKEAVVLTQVLNRQFVLDQVGEVRQQLASGAADGLEVPEVSRRRAAPEMAAAVERELEGEEPPRPDEVAEALDLLQEAVYHERLEPSGQPGFTLPPPERRGEEPAPIDDTAFLSRDPVISNFQAALELYYEQEPELALDEAEERRGGGEEVAVSDRSIAGLPARRESDGRRVFEQFSTTDPRWVSSAFAMGIRRMRKRHPFNPRPAPPAPLAEDARVVLVGDWGSGLPRARRVAERIRADVAAARRDGRQVHVVHLGDVYYSGWRYEYERRFLRWWPVAEGEAGVSSWTLNGNHDMYAGGHAYYGTALADPRFAGHRDGDGHTTSFFSLENPHWTILGLDTAWEDHGLEGPQAEWALERLAAGPGKGLLLSHHQIRSAKERVPANNPLRAKSRPVLDSGRVAAWFWGHEHRAVAYEPIPGLRYPRCIGHGGVPVYAGKGEDDPLPPGVVWEHRKSFRHGLETWALFGHAVLDLHGPEIDVAYYDEHGGEGYRETLR
jgi:hypothetical protein